MRDRRRSARLPRSSFLDFNSALKFQPPLKGSPYEARLWSHQRRSTSSCWPLFRALFEHKISTLEIPYFQLTGTNPWSSDLDLLILADLPQFN